MRKMLLPFALLAAPANAQTAPSAPAPMLLESGAEWAAEVPANWNGTLLLWSRGYSPRSGTPEVAPANVRAELLAAGYALAASNYGSGGWSLEEAVPAQTATIAAFAAKYGKPRRVIAWGASMGGLVTTALAEARPTVIHGGLAMCASIGGAVGMLNMALDGAFAFRTLVAPDAGIQLVGIADDRANGARVGAALTAAMETPEGRAQVALAGVLAGLPAWTTRGGPEPAEADAGAQVREMAKVFVMGVFLPRADQEKRAGVGYSWNAGVDYRAQLERSGRRAMVAALYEAAGLDLEADLARLAAAPRIAADPKAVDYMMRHYTPNARPGVPLLTVQTIGDGLTSPSLQQAYLNAAGGQDVQGLWLREAGHCGFAPAAVKASLRQLEARLERGSWPARPEGFIDWRPAPMLRPCVRGGACE